MNRKLVKRLTMVVFIALLIAGCGGKETPSQREVFEVRSIGTLSTTEYTLGKVLKINDEGEWYKWGDRKILMSCKARVKAGVNLAKLKDDDIKVAGSAIEIHLPAAEIVSFEMDPNEVRTEMVDINGFRADFSQNDKNQILALGEKSIREDLATLNILADAEQNAKRFLEDFYSNMGFETVTIHGTQETK